MANTDFAAVIRAQCHRLRDFIETQFGLLRELLALRVLNDEQVEIIRTERTRQQRVDKLLDYVIRLSHAQQRKFLLALYKTGQTHVNNFILANGHRTLQDGENWPLMDDQKSLILFTKLPELSKKIDTQTGLLEELLSVGCINEEQKQHVEVQNTTANRNETLLDMLLCRSVGDYTKFVGCLVKTKQFQVACLLDAGTPTGHAPLSEVLRSRLVRRRSILLNLIDSRHSLVAQMYEADCITRQQRDFIEKVKSQSQRNTRLLDIIERGGQSDFNKFLKCLEATGQKHICSILTTDPAVALLVAKTGHTRTIIYSRTRPLINAGKKNVNENERKIVERFMTLLRSSSDERREQLSNNVFRFVEELRNGGVQPIAATRHSIELYFTYASLNGLFYLERVHSSGKLNALLGSLFSALLDNSRCVTVISLVWEVSSYVECAQHLCNGAGLLLHRDMYQLMRCMLNVGI
jgi:hypothetical protein